MAEAEAEVEADVEAEEDLIKAFEDAADRSCLVTGDTTAAVEGPLDEAAAFEATGAAADCCCFKAFSCC